MACTHSNAQHMQENPSQIVTAHDRLVAAWFSATKPAVRQWSTHSNDRSGEVNSREELDGVIEEVRGPSDLATTKPKGTEGEEPKAIKPEWGGRDDIWHMTYMTYGMTSVNTRKPVDSAAEAAGFA